MPTERGKDSKGHFYRWGSQGKKYYFDPNNAESQRRAKSKADAQGRAINARRSE